MITEKETLWRERSVVALISAAHFSSHFFILTLPPLFLFIQKDIGVSFTALGAVITVYAFTTAFLQYPAGILIDRYGPRWFLIGGLSLVVLSIGLIGFVGSYPPLIALAFLAGIGDSVFHPADFAVLSARIRPERLGRTYAVHAFMGFVGFAAAPVTIDFLRVVSDWQTALQTAALGGLAMIALLFVFRNLLSGEDAVPAPAGEPAPPQPGALTFLKSTPILVLFLYYIAFALAGQGIHTYSPSALPDMYGVGESTANRALFVYLASTAIGVLVGGFIADRFGRFDLVAAVGYLVAGVAMCLVALVLLPFSLVVVAFGLSGFMVGSIMPSRDLQVRASTPKGSAGKAFGFVSSGIGYGAAIGPLLFGWVMDAGWPPGVYYGTALFMMASIVLAIAATRIAGPAPRIKPQPAE